MSLYMHVSADADQLPDEMLQHFTRQDGTGATPDEVRAEAQRLRSEGYEVFPCSAPDCEHSDCIRYHSQP